MEQICARSLDAAIQIGEYLISESISDNNGIYWLSWKKNNSINCEIEYDFFPAIDFYSGNSGIVYFLLNLYKATKNKKYLRISEEAIDWVIANIEKTEKKSGFYTGDYGIYLSASKFMQIGKTIKYKGLIEKRLKNIQIDAENYDIISGHAGSILALLGIMDDKIISVPKTLLEKHINYLITGVKYRNKQFAYEQDYEYPISGFSHGQSGIAYVLTELAYHFKSYWLYDISESLYEYEDSYKVPNTLNYRDMRSYLYLNNNLDGLSLREVNNGLNMKEVMYGWCHGLPGIALSRLHYYYRTNEEKYLNQINEFIKFYEREFELLTNGSISCLCHGDVGNLEFLIEYSYIFNDNERMNFVRKNSFHIFNKLIKNGFINNTSNHPNDYSLMGGIAGIGYHFLRLYSPTNFKSILLFRQSNETLKFNVKIEEKVFLESFIDSNFTFTKKKESHKMLNQYSTSNLLLNKLKNISRGHDYILADIKMNTFVSNHNLDYKHYIENKRQQSKKKIENNILNIREIKLVSYNNFIILTVNSESYIYCLKNFNYFLISITNLELKILNSLNPQEEILNVLMQLEDKQQIINFTTIIKSIISNGILFIH
jgi:hypothetical protein